MFLRRVGAKLPCCKIFVKFNFGFWYYIQEIILFNYNNSLYHEIDKILITRDFQDKTGKYVCVFVCVCVCVCVLFVPGYVTGCVKF